MRSCWVCVVAFVGIVGDAYGQTTPPAEVRSTGPLVNLFQADFAPSSPQIWGSAEYLYFWTSHARISAPLVTANPDSTSIAALGEPGTTILYGAGANDSIDFGAGPGWRVQAGSWLSADRVFGLEAAGMGLAQRSSSFQAASEGGTTTVVSIPFRAIAPFNLNPAGETSLNSGNAANLVSVNSTSQLWGAELNGLFDMTHQGGTMLPSGTLFTATGLLGFRYLNLSEAFGLTDTFFDPTTNGNIQVDDVFRARNQFYGGQFGTRFGLANRWLFIESTTKFAVGLCHQNLNIAGSSTVRNGAFGVTSGTTPVGLFAEPSNIGRHQHDVFAIAPSFDVKGGVMLGKYLKAFVGYNLVYLDKVIRAPNQINREINPNQNNFFVPGGVADPLVLPVATFRTSDFWAQGVSIGFEVHY